MNEVKNPKKPLVYYYAIVILVILALNFLAVPWLSQRQVKEVDYGTFMTMTENQEIGRVEVQNNQILFTNKDDTQVYKTGLMDDPDLIYRLKDSGAEFSSEIVEQMSPFLSFHSEVDNVPPTRTMCPLVRYSERRIWFSLLLRTLTHVVTAFPCEKSSTAMSKAINEPCVPSIT